MAYPLCKGPLRIQKSRRGKSIGTVLDKTPFDKEDTVRKLCHKERQGKRTLYKIGKRGLQINNSFDEPHSEPLAVAVQAKEDDHNHFGIYGMMEAIKAIVLAGDDKQAILSKIQERARDGPEGPIAGICYDMGAGVTRLDLDNLNLGRPIILISSSLHGGVASTGLLNNLHNLVAGKKIKGEMKENGEIYEGYFFKAFGLAEEMLGDRLVKGIVDWTLERVKEGTTSIVEKAILTTAEWAALKEAVWELKVKLGYNPVPKVYFLYEAFEGQLSTVAEEARALGIEPGVKWIGDGGFGVQTASLKEYSYKDGSKGLPLTIPIEYRDPEAVAAFIRELQEAGIELMAMHAIGDNTIGAALDLESYFRKANINFTIEHLELPTGLQIELAARLIKERLDLGKAIFSLNMEPNFCIDAKVIYEIEHLTEVINPVGQVLGTLKSHGIPTQEVLRFGTDGMPGHHLASLVCATAHPSEKQRISEDDYFLHSYDPRNKHGFVLVDIPTWEDIVSIRENPERMNEFAANIYEYSAKFQNGVLAVVGAGDRLLYSNLPGEKQ